MSRYGIIYSAVFDEERFRKLSSDSKVMLFYLVRGKHGNYSMTDCRKESRFKTKEKIMIIREYKDGKN